MSAFHQLVLPGLGGEELPLAQFGDRITLVVNVASQCGLTPQYAGLERLQQQYAARGFSVLGVPCNQFAAQEPGSDDEIRSFCTLNYGVSFLSGKLEVNGPQRHPLYRLLAGEGADFPGTSAGTSRSFSSARTVASWRASRRAPRRTILP